MGAATFGPYPRELNPLECPGYSYRELLPYAASRTARAPRSPPERATLGGMRPLATALALSLALMLATGARAAETAHIQATLNSDGTGSMIANVSMGHSGELWSWQACTENQSSCVPFASGQIVNTGGASPGTVFSATESLADATTTSPVWHGNVSALTLPGVSGEVRAICACDAGARDLDRRLAGRLRSHSTCRLHDPGGERVHHADRSRL